MVKPDIFCAGIKEKYVVQKMGVPCKQLHSYDYGGPYAGFQGAINFYAEIDRMVNAKVWSYIKPPWEIDEPAADATAEEPDYDAVDQDCAQPRPELTTGRAALTKPRAIAAIPARGPPNTMTSYDTPTAAKSSSDRR